MKFDHKFGATSALQEFLFQNPQQFNFIVEGMKHYLAEYQRALEQVDPASAAHSFHKLIDELIGKVIEASCKEGCSFCCYMEVHITPDEAELLGQYWGIQGH